MVGNVKAVQSTDGKTLIITDTSDYAGQGQNISDYTRSVLITDSADEIFADLDFAGNNLTVETPLTKDQWLSVKLIGTGPESFEKVINIGLERFANNAFNCKKILCCGNNAPDYIHKILAKAQNFLYGSEIDLQSGNGPSYDINISDAYTVLTS